MCGTPKLSLSPYIYCLMYTKHIDYEQNIYTEKKKVMGIPIC